MKIWGLIRCNIYVCGNNKVASEVLNFSRQRMLVNMRFLELAIRMLTEESPLNVCVIVHMVWEQMEKIFTIIQNTY